MSTQFAPIWNNASVDFSCIKANVTDSNSGSNSTLLDLLVGGTSKFKVDKSGTLIIGNQYTWDNESLIKFGPNSAAVNFNLKVGSGNSLWFTAGSTALGIATRINGENYNSALVLRSDGKLGWATGTSVPTESVDLFLQRDAAGILAQRRANTAGPTTYPQAFRIYNNVDGTDTAPGSNWERAKIAWESNVLVIGTEAGGTGTTRDLSIRPSTGVLTIKGRNAAGGVLKISDDPTYGIYTISTESGSASDMYFKAYSLFSFTTGSNNTGLFVSGGATTLPSGKYLIFADYINGDLGGSQYLCWNGVQSTSPALQLGKLDAAAPVAQTLQVQSVSAGTSNTSGVNFKIKGSSGTGTGAGGSIILQTAPAGSSGTAKNSFIDSMVVQSSGIVSFGGTTSSFPAIKRNSAALNFRLADDSADCDITAAKATFSGRITISEYMVSSVTSDIIAGADGSGYYFGCGLGSGTTPLFVGTAGAGTNVFLGGTTGSLYLRGKKLAFRVNDAGGGQLLQAESSTVLSLLDSTNAQTFRIYNTYTDATNNFERGKIGWSGGVFQIGTEKGLTSGAARALELQTDGTTRLTIGATGNGNATFTGSVTANSAGLVSSGSGYEVALASNFASSNPGVGTVSNHQFCIYTNSTKRLQIESNGTAVTFSDAVHIAVGTTTGTKIGTATNQLLGFWNAAPVAQPTTAVGSATVASPGAGSTIKTDDTFDGYTIQQVVKALRNIGILA